MPWCHTSQHFHRNCLFSIEFFAIRLPITKHLCCITKCINTFVIKCSVAVCFQFKRLRRQKTFQCFLSLTIILFHLVSCTFFFISLIECHLFLHMINVLNIFVQKTSLDIGSIKKTTNFLERRETFLKSEEFFKSFFLLSRWISIKKMFNLPQSLS